MAEEKKRRKRSEGGLPLVDQGEHYGLPVTYNPDDDRFCVHAAGTTDGTEVLATFAGDSKGWANAIQYARRRRA